MTTLLTLLSKTSRAIYHVQGLWKCSCMMIDMVCNVTITEGPDTGQDL